MIVESPRGAVRAKVKVTDAMAPAGLFGNRSDRLQILWAKLCQSEPAYSFSRLRSEQRLVSAPFLSLPRARRGPTRLDPTCVRTPDPANKRYDARKSAQGRQDFLAQRRAVPPIGGDIAICSAFLIRSGSAAWARRLRRRWSPPSPAPAASARSARRQATPQHWTPRSAPFRSARQTLQCQSSVVSDPRGYVLGHPAR